MDQYESKSLIGISKELNPYYTGPLLATGGAIADMNRYIEKMEPNKIGTIEKRSITLLDTIDQVYTFKWVKTYTVTQDSAEFNVYYIKAKMNGERYDIIIELRWTDYYDRILRIYKDDEPHTLVLWIGTIKVKQKRDRRI